MGERVLNIEVVGIMKDSDYIAAVDIAATIGLTT